MASCRYCRMLEETHGEDNARCTKHWTNMDKEMAEQGSRAVESMLVRWLAYQDLSKDGSNE